jgi:hypothetical protein
LLDLLWGRAAAEIEYVLVGPFSFTLIPEYTFWAPGEDELLRINAYGAGVAGEFGYWMGRPLRSYFLKAHVGHRTTKFKSDIDEVNVPETQIGAFFGAQSIYGGWFSFSYGIGMVYDLQSKDRGLLALEPGSNQPQRDTVLYIIPASGALGNGFDILAQLSLGASF